MSARSGIVAVTAASLALCTACIMPDQFAQIQKDVADVRQQLQRIESEQAQARDRLEAATRPADEPSEPVTAEDLADLNFRMDQATRETASATQRLLDLSQRFERLSQEIERRRSDRGPASAAAPGPGRDGAAPARAGSGTAPARGFAGQADELYNTAYADFSKGNYELAIAGFEEFHATYPDHSQADNALYWVGECHFSQGQYAKAIQAFDRLLETFPDSDKAPSGDLKKGLAFLEQNQVSQAIVQFQHVRNTYGGTDEARVARERLTALGIAS